jgi:hypothetical protein
MPDVWYATFLVPLIIGNHPVRYLYKEGNCV